MTYVLNYQEGSTQFKPDTQLVLKVWSGSGHAGRVRLAEKYIEHKILRWTVRTGQYLLDIVLKVMGKTDQLILTTCDQRETFSICKEQYS